MGQRVERSSAAWQEEYILDLTKPYHNLLGIQKEEEAENFYWDFTAIATEGKGEPPRYYLQDELGSPLRVLYSTGKGEHYGYDEFGRDLALGERSCCKRGFTIPYTKQGEGQPFGYTGYRYDEISGSYFAQAREYQPGIGRFMAEDVIRGRMAVPKTLNRYGYCDNNPLMFVDNNGLEKIIISGGVYKKEKLDENIYYYEFIDASIAQINEWKKENNDEEITWIIADNGWTELNKSEFQKTADRRNVNLIIIEDKNELINYVNSKNVVTSVEQISADRETDLITEISVFSHGLSSNKGIISLGYDYVSNFPELNIGVNDIDAFLNTAFSDDIRSNFYSCNLGTGMEESFAQYWVNHVGGITTAYSGKSDYEYCSDRTIIGKICRNYIEWKYGVSAYGGATSLPTAGKNAKQIEFLPECSVE